MISSYDFDVSGALFTVAPSLTLQPCRHKLQRQRDSLTYGHTCQRTRDPVRSPLVKLARAELVVGSVTTSESSVLYVFVPSCPLFVTFAPSFNTQMFRTMDDVASSPCYVCYGTFRTGGGHLLDISTVDPQPRMAPEYGLWYLEEESEGIVRPRYKSFACCVVLVFRLRHLPRPKPVATGVGWMYFIIRGKQGIIKSLNCHSRTPVFSLGFDVGSACWPAHFKGLTNRGQILLPLSVLKDNVTAREEGRNEICYSREERLAACAT